MKQRKALLGLVAAVGAAGVVAVPVVAAQGAAPSQPVSGVGMPATDVRLVSGDVVTLGGEHGAQVRAAKGREHVAFYIREDEQGDTQVVPEDAVVPLEQGRLDPALFDVSELARAGYTNTVPLIVDYRGPTPRSATATVRRELPVLSATAVDADLGGGYWATMLTAERVWLDARMRTAQDNPVDQVGAPAAWEAGHTGVGATVAVLDSGIDTTHPDLADAVVDTKIFSDSTTIDDTDGWGTAVASVITGDGEKYRGVAPDAKLLIGKVVDDDGWTQVSSVVAAMEWAAASGADVVNMSLGSGRPSDGTDAVSVALNDLTAKTGALFVAAAGDTGLDNWVGTPAAADATLAVGAVDRNDGLAYWSGRGPRLRDGAIKPDITAPGVSIVGAKAANGTQGGPVEDGYIALSGTGMATPFVAGAAAILAAQHPDWTAEQLKAALMGTAEPNGDLTVFEQGSGRVDVAAATQASVVASVGTLDFGTAAWPHQDDKPVTRTVTYTNTGIEPVTLDLTADVRSARGVEAPDGMFTFTPASLTVPAGGQASTTVTADTRVSAPDSLYTGAIVATGAGRTVRTTLKVNREAETHAVTVNILGFDGAPTDQFATRFTNVDPERYSTRSYRPYDPSGTVTVRLPKGEYFVDATVLGFSEQGDRHNAVFAEPAFTVTGDTTVTFDARESKPVELRTDKPNAKAGKGWIALVRDTAQGQLGVRVSGQAKTLEGMTVRPSTTSSDQFQFVAEAHLAEWNGTSFDNSPYLYHLRHTERGAVPEVLRWHKRDRDLAKVRSDHARTRPGTLGLRDYFLFFPLPHTLTEYYTPDKVFAFEQEFVELLESDRYTAVTVGRQIAPMVFSLGKTTTMRWGVGVHGPAMPTSEYHPGDLNAVRESQDWLQFSVPMLTDHNPGRVGYTYPGTTHLLRDGVEIGKNTNAGSGTFVNMAPGRAKYTLRATADPMEAGLSTHINAEWTFTSEHVDDFTVIPLLALRFAPNLDNHNAAPAGKRFTIPLYAQRNGAPTPGPVDTPTVEVSYDDGKTWQPAKVTAHRDAWKATVNHPRDAEFVSLRSSITDADGNSQSQTIIRAYALK
ncbi:S8 family peptidase [Actinophytocola sp.]|uniref:S8 family peptidase n=1 Tax=Actinophytocola sp. TaxID=1872138 RepID=UPI002ED2A4EB